MKMKEYKILNNFLVKPLLNTGLAATISLGGLVGCVEEPTSPVVIIDKEDFASFREYQNVGIALGTVSSCTPGTPQALIHRFQNKAIEHGANLIVLSSKPAEGIAADASCYRGVVYRFTEKY